MKKSWTIRLPFQPKDSGKFFHGSFNILGFEFSDRLPRRLNNFLWKIREIPVIHEISVFLARGGAKRCFRCTERMYPWQVTQSEGNVWEQIFPTQSTHTDCKISPKSNMAKVQFIEDHSFAVFYQPDWFVPKVLDSAWNKIASRASHWKIKPRMEKYPIHKLIKEKLEKDN